MRLPASEKLEIIGLVEQSHLPARRTLQMLGIKPSTFYRWYDRFRSGGPEALEDKAPKPDRVWNRIPDDIRQRVVMMAFEQPELSPRELATRFTDTNSYYVSESSVYRLLKAHDLIGSRSASPRRFRSRRSSLQDCALSRMPSIRPTSSFFPSDVAPMITSRYCAASSSLACTWMPSAEKYTYRLAERSRLLQRARSSDQQASFSRPTVAAESLPSSATSASRGRRWRRP